MKKLICTLVVLVPLLLPGDALAQYGLHTRSGVGVGGEATLSSDASTYGARAGYVLASDLELGVTATRATPDSTTIDRTGVGPYVAFYPVLQQEGYPLSIVMTGDYNYHQFTDLPGGGTETGHSVRFGTGLFAAIQVSEAVRLVPFVGARFTRNSTAGILTNANERTSLNFRLPVQIAVSEAASVVVRPSVLVGDGGTTRYGASASLVFSLGGDD